MLIRIEGRDLPGRSCRPSPDFPGYDNIHVGVQRRANPREHLDLQPGDAPSVVWTFDATVDGADVRGAYIQGPRAKRFIYLSWGTVSADGTFTMFRRAKLFTADIDAGVLAAAEKSGTLVARLSLTDAKGHPACAWIRSPDWSPGPS